jgi:hypothetical protein
VLRLPVCSTSPTWALPCSSLGRTLHTAAQVAPAGVKRDHLDGEGAAGAALHDGVVDGFCGDGREWGFAGAHKGGIGAALVPGMLGGLGDVGPELLQRLQPDRGFEHEHAGVPVVAALLQVTFSGGQVGLFDEGSDFEGMDSRVRGNDNFRGMDSRDRGSDNFRGMDSRDSGSDNFRGMDSRVRGNDSRFVILANAGIHDFGLDVAVTGFGLVGGDAQDDDAAGGGLGDGLVHGRCKGGGLGHGLVGGGDDEDGVLPPFHSRQGRQGQGRGGVAAHGLEQGAAQVNAGFAQLLGRQKPVFFAGDD